MKVFSKLVCLTLVGLLASNFLCRGEETAQWGDLIGHSTQMEAVLLEYKRPGNNETYFPLVERTPHVNLNKDQIILVKQLFNTATNYESVATDCGPQYGARLILHFYNNLNHTNDPPKKLQLDFCFSCGHMAAQLDGKQLAGKHDGFLPMREPLLNLFKELFPKDSPIAVWPK
jgi:hypothetical protein